MDGMSCIIGGKPFVEQLKCTSRRTQGHHRLGRGVRAACRRRGRTRRRPPVHKVITDKPIIKVPGCPPIAEVMTGVITFMRPSTASPELDRQAAEDVLRQRIHDKCYRRPHFRCRPVRRGLRRRRRAQGLCLYKLGCKGPTTYNACSTVRWNEGTSFRSSPATAPSLFRRTAFWDKGLLF